MSYSTIEGIISDQGLLMSARRRAELQQRFLQQGSRRRVITQDQIENQAQNQAQNQVKIKLKITFEITLKYIYKFI